MGASSSRKEVELRWTPRLKTSGRSPVGTTESAVLAQQALAGMKTVDKIRRRGGSVDEVLLARLACPAQPVALPIKPVQSGRRLPIRAFFVGGSVCVAAALIAVVAVGRGRPLHAVAGVMLLDNRPLPGARLTFHPVDAGSEPVAAETTDVGRFAVDELPAGAYRVTIDGGVKVPRNLPVVYTSPGDAILGLTVMKDMDDVRMYARRDYKPSTD